MVRRSVSGCLWQAINALKVKFPSSAQASLKADDPRRQLGGRPFSEKEEDKHGGEWLGGGSVPILLPASLAV